jgi:hypothetical protein
MHLITGFLLTALLGRKRGQRRIRLPSFPGILETAHMLPGRVRFRVPALEGLDDVAAEVRQRLRKLEGVQSVDVSTVSGSVLLTFRPEDVDPEMLLAAVIRLLGLEEQIEQAPRSRLGFEIREMGAALNRAVHEKTGGMIDLWTALPLVLVALGVRNLVSRNGQPGWPLLWWAYLALFPPGMNQD